MDPSVSNGSIFHRKNLSPFSNRSIHANAKEYGFGQSLLHEGQLVFHTPPYSLQPVSLQDTNETIGKANIRIIRPHPIVSQPTEQPPNTSNPETMRRSPMPHHRNIGDLSPQPAGIIPLSKAASGDRVDRHSSYTAKVSSASTNGAFGNATAAGGGVGGGGCSPSTLERRSRRFSSDNSRQNINSHEVPYARLLDSPSRISTNTSKLDLSAMAAADSRVSPTMSMRQPQQGWTQQTQQQQQHHSYHQYQQQMMQQQQHQLQQHGQFANDGLMTTSRALRIPTSNARTTSSSDSKLTVDYFQSDPMDLVMGVGGGGGGVGVGGGNVGMPDEMSHSAPQPHALESDSDPSLSPKMMSEDEIVREVCERPISLFLTNQFPKAYSIFEHSPPLQVQRTISLTSENPSEAFFSADEDLHTSRSSSLRTTDHRLLPHPKKRFASDMSIGGLTAAAAAASAAAGGAVTSSSGGILHAVGVGSVAPLDAKLSTHRSDYEIHSPEHRSMSAKRPQSTAELVS